MSWQRGAPTPSTISRGSSPTSSGYSRSATHLTGMLRGRSGSGLTPKFLFDNKQSVYYLQFMLFFIVVFKFVVDYRSVFIRKAINAFPSAVLVFCTLIISDFFPDWILMRIPESGFGSKKAVMIPVCMMPRI